MAGSIRTIVVFAKLPEPGRVKTRLIGKLSPGQAAEVHRRCLRLTLEAAAAVPDARVLLATSPPGADFSKQIDTDGVACLPQGDGDLGDRLLRVLGGLWAEECGQIVVVGSDCPSLGPDDICLAFQKLKDQDVVIGPCPDGGYYLVGLAGRHPELFEGIAWSSRKVLGQTLQKASAAGLQVGLLPERRDVDVYDDVVTLAREIAKDDPRLAGFGEFLRAQIKDGEDRV